MSANRWGRIMANRKRLFRGCVLAATASLLCIAFAAQIDAQSGGRPQYAPGGMMRLPVGFESWVFVGSNLGLSYDPNLPVTDARERARSAQEQLFHDVYIDPEAYAHFAPTGTRGSCGRRQGYAPPRHQPAPQHALGVLHVSGARLAYTNAQHSGAGRAVLRGLSPETRH